jgi:hypothetical protein
VGTEIYDGNRARAFVAAVGQRYVKKPIVVAAAKVDAPVRVMTIDGNDVVVPKGAYMVIDQAGFPYPCDAGIFEANHTAYAEPG